MQSNLALESTVWGNSVHWESPDAVFTVPMPFSSGRHCHMLSWNTVPEHCTSWCLKTHTGWCWHPYWDPTATSSVGMGRAQSCVAYLVRHFLELMNSRNFSNDSYIDNSFLHDELILHRMNHIMVWMRNMMKVCILLMVCHMNFKLVPRTVCSQTLSRNSDISKTALCI